MIQINFYSDYLGSKLYSTGVVLKDYGTYKTVRVISGFMAGKTTDVFNENILPVQIHCTPRY